MLSEDYFQAAARPWSHYGNLPEHRYILECGCGAVHEARSVDSLCPDCQPVGEDPREVEPLDPADFYAQWIGWISDGGFAGPPPIL